MSSRKSLSEASGTVFMGKNLVNQFDNERLLLNNALKEKEINEINAKKKELTKAKQEEILEKVNTIELVPWGNRVVIVKYPENPYRQIVSKGGILIPDKVAIKNDQTGEEQYLEEGIVCGKIIEVGPDCKQVRVGDDVFYQKNTSYPIPFMNMGYVQTSEPQLLTIIAEGLKERLNIK